VDNLKDLIFRSYDIRGVYRNDIDAETMERIGMAFGTYTKEDVVVVCGDVRITTPEIMKAFIKGAVSTGKIVINGGILPLGAGMFHAWKNNHNYAYITASHLPREWTGVKFFHGNGIGFMEKEGERIKELFGKGKFKSGKGEIRKESPQGMINEYIEYLISKVIPDKKLRVVIDCGNGASCFVAPKLFKVGGFNVQAIYGEPDGNFPKRSPDPMEDPLIDLRNSSKKADMGIAYDGDGDRMVIMDNKGNRLTPEQSSYIMLTELLKTEKGPIVANVEINRVIDDIASKFGREIIRLKVGHTFLMQGAKDHKASYGVERAAHYVIPSIVPFDDSMAVSFFMACVLSKLEKPLSELVDEIPKYPFERVNLECPDQKKTRVIDTLKAELSKEFKNINTLDGIRIDFPEGWVLIRQSNTAAIIRITMEAKSEKALEDLKERFVPMVREEITKR
jgi:phosphomannomutase